MALCGYTRPDQLGTRCPRRRLTSRRPPRRLPRAARERLLRRSPTPGTSAPRGRCAHAAASRRWRRRAPASPTRAACPMLPTRSRSTRSSPTSPRSSRATELPVNADFQAGYADDAEGVAANVGRCVEAGVAGLSIEDADRDGSGRLFEIHEAIERIRAARAAIDASGADVLLTGRAECFLTGHPEPLGGGDPPARRLRRGGRRRPLRAGIRERGADARRSSRPVPRSRSTSWSAPTSGSGSATSPSSASAGSASAPPSRGSPGAPSCGRPKSLATDGSFAALRRRRPVPGAQRALRAGLVLDLREQRRDPLDALAAGTGAELGESSRATPRRAPRAAVRGAGR